MNSIFLRIYGGLLATLVLVALLGVFTLHQVNEVRADRYRESLARGTFRLMSDNLEPMTQVERRRALVLWSRLLGIPLALQDLDEDRLDSGVRSRVLRRQVMVEQTGPHAAKVYSLVSEKDHLVLTGEVQQISEQLARATVYLLIDELVRYPVSEQPQRLAALKESKQFGFDLHLVTLENADLDEDQRRRVDEGDTVMALGKGGDSIRIFAGIVDTPWVLEIGPLVLMNPYPPELLILIGVLGLSLIGLTIYLLVRQLERRLLGLEAAATRIAHGKLDARVPARGADSVGRLAAAFNGMAEQLQQLLSVQRELVRAVSHELRTPVARLRFGLEMIADAETDTARRKYMEGMDGDIQELDKLVDEMLTYARLEQGTPALNFQRVDLDALMEQVIAELAPLRPAIRVERGHAFGRVEEGAWVEAEPRYLHRALQNLVSNAMRHAESRVRLSFQIGEALCRIDVEDDGPGVPESAWERIFTPFLRLDDSRTRASGGHGLGLSIVRRIIYWHSGRAQIGRSEALGGAQFSLVWPCRQGERLPS
ncbi:ATP-binding protein [Metapseudomonas otitidis]|uniref:histidine kinase n=1 Tax=Metapseudomonas otitidis TaxID=319939 RepID=A0A679GBP9_9GAMM|nr:ATP-binding protein [Pseudomonas otitidis]MCO7554148.1 ATP-binding protein [Pseudomonas otitidis]QZX84609.1 HAMP domain-containing protein [Pseudomonas otitidis]BCA27605.1 two-component sensor histidine kinase [Pseudomonas otitidis]